MQLNNIKKIGIVGGGASALMLCIEAAKLGIQTALLDPEVNCVGSAVATEHMVAVINSQNIKKLSLRTDCVIFNTKINFDIDTKLHSITYPSKETLQDLSQYKNILDALETVEIPAPKAYYQDNREASFQQVERLTLPFRFVKEYSYGSEELDIYTKEDLTDFILEIDENAKGFILQPIPEYKQIISCLCLVDEKGKYYLYEPCIEKEKDHKVSKLSMASNISKAMHQKLVRYNKKLLKEIKGTGAFTIKYGIKANKSVEFFSITPEISLAGLLTIDAYETSIYEKYLQLILGMKLEVPQLQTYVEGTVKQIEDMDEKPCHIYNLGLTNLCITKKNEEDTPS